MEEVKTEKVNHPNHYTWFKEKTGVEVIDIIRLFDYNKGAALGYILRSGHKEEAGYTMREKEIEDLQKAIWQLQDEIKMLQAQHD